MKVQLIARHARAVAERFPEHTSLLQQLKLGTKAEVPFYEFTRPQLAFVRELFEAEGGAMASRAAQVATLEQALSVPGRTYGEGDLEHLVADLVAFLMTDAVRGWLFQVESTGKPIAYLVSRIDFTPAGEEEAARLLIELKANAMGKVTTKQLPVRERDIHGKTLAEILASKGLLKETAALVAEYDRSTERFFALRADYGHQFSARGTGIYAEDPTASHRNTDWSRKNTVVLSSSGGWARVVNDESILPERDLTIDLKGDILGTYLRKAGRSTKFNSDVERAVEHARDAVPAGLFTQLPIHGYILVFHLELHHHLWVHVDDMQPYRYQPELKTKLILPPEHTDLIDILTAEMDVLMDDIVEGKSGGTTVLCSGPPGVGKTLTAEVYSEIIQRPLYRVHSGQLGLNVGEMEVALKNALTRAQRWGAVMLIDEADVYIRRRDDNLAANAVVGVFLRVLEYFNGLLFLTTNRTSDIDEAITSRCIAVIKYHPPDAQDRRRIWRVMTEQFALEVPSADLDTLSELFPEACGRDIKGLTKLVAKYCSHKQVTPSLDVFKRCSTFRGLNWRE